MLHAKIMSVCCQPNASMRPTASGEYRNWPNEPAAVPRPKANVRHCGGTSLPNAASTTGNEQPDSPKPMSTPADISSISGARRIGHERETGGIKHRTCAQHFHRAVAVGDHAGERLANAPQQVLDRDRERENVAAPVIGARQRRQEEAERRARSECDDREHTAEHNDHHRRAPGRHLRCRGGGRGGGGHWSSGGRA